MKFCTEHWDKLRVAIADQGLDSLVSRGGAEAVERMSAELGEGQTLDNFDPLMAAHWAIVDNVSRHIQRAGGNPLYLLSNGPEDPVSGYGAAHEGRTWPRCPLCYINLVHELTCKGGEGGGCTLPTLGGFDWMIERAASDARDRWRELSARPGPASEEGRT